MSLTKDAPPFGKFYMRRGGLPYAGRRTRASEHELADTGGRTQGRALAGELEQAARKRADTGRQNGWAGAGAPTRKCGHRRARKTWLQLGQVQRVVSFYCDFQEAKHAQDIAKFTSCFQGTFGAALRSFLPNT